MLSINDVNLSGKRVLIREDLNVPIINGEVTSVAKLKAILPGLTKILAMGAQVTIMSHLGRPYGYQSEFSLSPVAKCLENLIQKKIEFVSTGFVSKSELALLENVRFYPGETKNDLTLAREMANNNDIFIMDAFASAHRAHASTVGVAQYVEQKIAGPLLISEMNALDLALENPKHPVIAIIGGGKTDTKKPLIDSLNNKVDKILLGSAFTGANDLTEQQILDYATQIKTAKTIIWNGPLGIFEDPKYEHGTKKIAELIAESDAYSVVGGGETISALEKYNLLEKMSYVSTGGGAFLEYIKDKNLPGLAYL